MFIETYKTNGGYVIETYNHKGNRTYHCQTKKELKSWLKVIKRKQR